MANKGTSNPKASTQQGKGSKSHGAIKPSALHGRSNDSESGEDKDNDVNKEDEEEIEEEDEESPSEL